MPLRRTELFIGGRSGVNSKRLDYLDIIERLRERLKSPLPGIDAQMKMMGRVIAMPPVIPENARPSAVLCLLFPVNGALHMLLMKRREDHTAHSGQVSFPGGSYDQSDADFKATALREANEEVGILSSEVDILGALTSLYIPVSNFNVYPYVGFATQQPKYNLSHNEVAYTLEVPLDTLFHKDIKTIAEVRSPKFPDVVRKVNAYILEDKTVVWGATAMIISELETILEEIK